MGTACADDAGAPAADFGRGGKDGGRRAADAGVCLQTVSGRGTGKHGGDEPDFSGNNRYAGSDPSGGTPCGGGFSEGQAQRISIARALLRKSPILLLDEATSALDVFTERQVLRNIVNSGYARTCIVTTHRPSVLTMCDRVYRINSGDVSDIDEKDVNRLIKDF